MAMVTMEISNAISTSTLPFIEQRQQFHSSECVRMSPFAFDRRRRLFTLKALLIIAAECDRTDEWAKWDFTNCVHFSERFVIWSSFQQFVVFAEGSGGDAGCEGANNGRKKTNHSINLWIQMELCCVIEAPLVTFCCERDTAGKWHRAMERFFLLLLLLLIFRL